MKATLVIAVLLGATAQQDATVWVASPWQRVLRDSPAGNQTEAHIKAAANEYEPVRLIVSAGKEMLKDVTAEVSDLRSGEHVIEASHVQMFRAHYLHIPEPSFRTKNPTGWYPDALIPFVDPQTGEDLHGAVYDSVPFVCKPGQNAEIWCDIYVPPSTPAGLYRGAVTVTAGKRELTKVPVELQVWGFELPAELAMRSNFGALGSRMTSMVAPGSTAEEAAAIEQLYVAELLRHRAVPSSLGDIWPAWTPDGGIEETGQAERLRAIVEKEHVNALRVPVHFGDNSGQTKAHLTAIANWLRDLGYLDLAYIYLRDEPNDAEQYEMVRQQGKLIHEAAPDLARMCTEQTITSNTEWGNLYGAVDIWCPLWGLWDEPTANERLRLGERLWSYTALCQGPKTTPWWQIDMEPVHFRAPFWVSWRYNITGFLYWSSVFWQTYGGMEGVWERPAFRDKFWGEGMLVYPGPPAGIKGPVPSIRLKLVREALEDYEYMSLAAGVQGERQAKQSSQQSDTERKVDGIVTDVVRSFQDWSHDPEDYEQARQRLVEIILTKP